MKSIKKIVPINQMVQTSHTINLENKTKEAAIRLRMCITEHNIALRTSLKEYRL